MNFRAYNELRILGFTPEEAAAQADSYTPIGMYELKETVDNGSHGGGKVRTVGLKPEYKVLIINLAKEQDTVIQMPYATAFTLFQQKGMAKEAAHAAAFLYQDLEFASHEAARETVGIFSEIHSHNPDAAMRLLKSAQEVRVFNFEGVK